MQGLKCEKLEISLYTRVKVLPTFSQVSLTLMIALYTYKYGHFFCLHNQLLSKKRKIA